MSAETSGSAKVIPLGRIGGPKPASDKAAAGEARPTPPDRAVLAVQANREYAEFLPAAVEISVRPAPHVVPVMIGVVIAAIATALIWSWFAWLDVFTNAAGRVRATVPPAVVQPLEAGRVTGLAVRNGQHVAAGEVLITLDEVPVVTALDAAIAGRASWLAEAERRAAAYGALAGGDRGVPNVAFDAAIPAAVIRRETEALLTEHQALIATLSTTTAQREEAEARRARFIEVKAARTRLLAVLTERAAMSETLQTSSAGSRAAILTTLEARVRAEVDLADTATQLAEIEATIRTSREREAEAVAAYLANQSRGIQAAERQVEQLEQEIRRQRDRRDHLALKAPVAGTVQQLAATGTGQIVAPGQPVLVIVPDTSGVTVEALIPSAEIGFVKVGDPAVIKADAFPFTRYGTFSGRVAHISTEAVTLRDAQALQDATATAQGQATSAPNGLPTVTGLFFIARIDLDSAELPLRRPPATPARRISTSGGDVEPQTATDGNGRTLALAPGMTVRIEIKTETRRVIDYLLSPVSQVLNEAGHET